MIVRPPRLRFVSSPFLNKFVESSSADTGKVASLIDGYRNFVHMKSPFLHIRVNAKVDSFVRTNYGNNPVVFYVTSILPFWVEIRQLLEQFRIVLRLYAGPAFFHQFFEIADLYAEPLANILFGFSITSRLV